MKDPRLQRSGEANGRTILGDNEVELLRTLREEELVLPGQRRYWTYDRLAEKFEISKRHVIELVLYRKR